MVYFKQSNCRTPPYIVGRNNCQKLRVNSLMFSYSGLIINTKAFFLRNNCETKTYEAKKVELHVDMFVQTLYYACRYA